MSAGMINAGDLLAMQRIVPGIETATACDLLIDPPGALDDAVTALPDLLRLRQKICTQPPARNRTGDFNGGDKS